MRGALTGYRILDLSNMVSGPLATRILGDEGADVIKVEAPAGDLTRQLGPKRGGLSATFLSINRNKRSVVLDLKRDGGRQALEHLLRSADVFVQNFRPGTIERMGLDEETVRKLRPDIVYVSISGFGDSGPYAGKRVYDPIIQALSGLAEVQADRVTGQPRMVRVIVPDKVTALTAAQAITSALLWRERTGEGQHVRLSMLDSVVAFLWPEAMTAHTLIGDGVENPRRGSLADLIYPTADGYITISTLSDAEWQGLTRALEQPLWADDPRFATAAGRIENIDDRMEMVTAAVRPYTTDQLLELLAREDVPCAPILSRQDLLTDPQIAHNQLLVEDEHPFAGPIRQPRPAARFSVSPPGLHRPAPGLGEHSREVLEEIGLRSEEIERLQQSGALHQAARP